jgi:hypothetical protein
VSSLARSDASQHANVAVRGESTRLFELSEKSIVESVLMLGRMSTTERMAFQHNLDTALANSSWTYRWIVNDGITWI